MSYDVDSIVNFFTPIVIWELAWFLSSVLCNYLKSVKK